MGISIHLFFIMIRIITHSKFKTNAGNIKFLNRGILSNLRKMYCRNLHVTMNGLNTEEAKQKLGPEKIFFEGPPSKVELIIPFFSLLTVIGIIPFITTLRISVDSGFQGKTRAEIVYRDIKKIRYIKRVGGEAADVVLVLKDNAQLELRSLPNWEENLNFIKSNCAADVDCQ